ncbi:MAG: hypothetical protein CO102_02245 [Candidatus Brennerbacteria bacterium CG_4_9_14_3_um_filter_43_9]|uniref:Uncharacterized protein n=1 Tax=Candidatus Brennerbacteria bacterium CG_4_9_14_3_um_filter_43_9 TaxID=1974522 RepID=A0A2M8C1M8_9BACT|nr:MAG: hypothetical protein CO102_02245 [Candidatus Brennerbacteria bacterium CG_4_9_14_3_um_filter_43_9]
MSETFEGSLRPFTQEQVTKGEKLPENISSITHSVEAGEKLKLDLIIDRISKVAHAIKGRTQERFAILGSMSMYATLNELRADGNQLMILEQRIEGGKNDYDVGVSPESLIQVMGSFEWNGEAKHLQRGHVGGGREMVDIMARRELTLFPWRETEIDGNRFFVQSAEEMIFEKMGALINPGADEQGESRIREVKWGVDIKLLKAYLTIKNGWDDKQVESYLSQRWGDYVEDTRYQGMGELVDLVKSGTPVTEVIKTALEKRLGKTDISDLSQELTNIFGEQGKQQIDSLLISPTPEQFEANLRALMDLRPGKKLSYEEASAQAEQEFDKLVRKE